MTKLIDTLGKVFIGLFVTLTIVYTVIVFIVMSV